MQKDGNTNKKSSFKVPQTKLLFVLFESGEVGRIEIWSLLTITAKRVSFIYWKSHKTRVGIPSLISVLLCIAGLRTGIFINNCTDRLLSGGVSLTINDSTRKFHV